MPLYSLALIGGERRRFDVAGKCFSVVSAPLDIQSVQLYRKAILIEDLQGPFGDGFEWAASWRQSFDMVDITAVADQTAVLFMGEGFARQSILTAAITKVYPINIIIGSSSV